MHARLRERSALPQLFFCAEARKAPMPRAAAHVRGAPGPTGALCKEGCDMSVIDVSGLTFAYEGSPELILTM